MIPRKDDQVGVFGDTRVRTQALSTGAHPSQFYWGGYGLNTQWQKLALQTGWTTPDTSKRLSVRVRADMVKFKGTVEYSGSVVPTRPVCVLPSKYAPAMTCTLTGEDDQGALVQIRFDPLGNVTIPTTPVGHQIKFNYVTYARG